MKKYELVWHNDEKTILRQVAHTGWTPDDFIAMASETYDWVTQQPHTVDLIMDLRDSQNDTPGKLLSTALKIEERVPANQGRLVVVGANRYLQTLLKYSTVLAPKASRNRFVVDTLEEAEAILKGTV